MQGRPSIGLGALAVLGLLAAEPTAQADTNLGTVDGLTYMRGLSGPPVASPAVVGADAACPAGTHVVGGGFTGSAVRTRSVQFWINSAHPFDGPDANDVPDDGWTGRGFNRLGTDKRAAVHAICSGGTVRYTSNSRSLSPGSAGVVRANCPAGTYVSGGGVSLDGPATEAFINASSPRDSKDADHTPDDGWFAHAYNQGGSSKTLSAYAACVSALPGYVEYGARFEGDTLSPGCFGDHAMGGGAAIAGPRDASWLARISPVGSPNDPPDAGFVATVYRADTNFAYLAVAICKS
jgi:hypothetical protein